MSPNSPVSCPGYTYMHTLLFPPQSCLSGTIIIYKHYIEDITRWREDMNFIFEWQNNILLTRCARS